MNKLLATIMLLSSFCLADGIMMNQRSNQSFRINSASDNIPAAPGYRSTSLVMSGIANGQHLLLCHESTARIRVNWSHGSLIDGAPPASNVFNAIIPAAASGSFACLTADDVQLSSAIYIWSDGSAVSSGLFYGSTW